MNPPPAPPSTASSRRFAWMVVYALPLFLIAQVHPSTVPLGLVIAAVLAADCAWTWRTAASGRAHIWAALLVIPLWAAAQVFLVYERPRGFVLFLLPVLAAVLVRLGMGAMKQRQVLARTPELPFAAMAAVIWFTARAELVHRWLDLPTVNEDLLFVMMAADQPGAVAPEGRKAAVDVVHKVLAQAGSEGDAKAARALGAGQAGLSAKVGDRVYVTLFHPDLGSTRGHADGGTLGEAVAEATAAAVEAADDGSAWKAKAAEVRTQIDVAGPPTGFRVTPGLKPSYKYLAKGEGLIDRARAGWKWWKQVRPLFEVEPGIDGLIIDTDGKHAEMIPAEPLLEGWLTPRIMGRDNNLDVMMKKACKRAGLPGDAWLQPGTRLQKFRTYSFGQPVPGGEVVELYRTNVPRHGVKAQDILDAIDIGGRWLLETAKDDGTFLYSYLPNEDKYPKDYNWVRHAGAVYGLYHMYNMSLREPQLHDDSNAYLKAAAKAMGGIFRNLGTPQGAPPDRRCLMEGTRCESGSAALTLLTLMERPKPEEVTHPALAERIFRPDDKEIMDGLALTMLDMIDDKGKVFRFYSESLTLDSVKKEPPYFPGECMLALARYYQMTGEQRWIEGARKIGNTQIKWTFDERKPNRIPDHWVMQALHIVYQATDESKYAKAAIKMGHRYNAEQFPPNKPIFEDYTGSYRRDTDVPRTTRAASRTEALGGSVRSAWDLKRGSDAKAMEDALLLAAEHMMEQQFTPQNSYYMKRPDRALGALRMGIVDNECRIDNNQHAAVGMTNALVVARKREGQEMPTQVTLPPPPPADEVVQVRSELAAAAAGGEGGPAAGATTDKGSPPAGTGAAGKATIELPSGRKVVVDKDRLPQRP